MPKLITQDQFDRFIILSVRAKKELEHTGELGDNYQEFADRACLLIGVVELYGAVDFTSLPDDKSYIEAITVAVAKVFDSQTQH